VDVIFSGRGGLAEAEQRRGATQRGARRQAAPTSRGAARRREAKAVATIKVICLLNLLCGFSRTMPLFFASKTDL